MATTNAHHPALSPTNGGIHVAHALEFVDATARNSFAAVPTDIGRIARQLDTGEFFILEDDSPLTWRGPLGGGAPVTSTPPVNVTKSAAVVGVGTTAARHDHKHDISTAAPGATGLGTSSGEGSATTLARSDHTHQSNTAPANVTKAAAAIGTSGEPARADHKHDVTTAAAVAVGTANAEGTSTSLARADHTHQVTGLTISGQVQGDILYFNGTSWVRLAPGTAGQKLQTNGAGANPSWVTVAAGGDVVGPASATNFSLARFDGTTGKLIKNTSQWTIDDAGVMNAVVATTGYAVTIQNSVSGELMRFVNSFGNPCHDFNKDGGGNGITRVRTNTGINTFEHVAGTGATSIGPANGLDAAWPLTVQGAATGNGARIRAGEVEGDIAFRITDQDGSFQLLDVHAYQGQFVYGLTYAAALSASGIVHGYDNRHAAGVGREDVNTQNGLFRLAGARANGAISTRDSTGGQTFTTGTITVALNVSDLNNGAGTGSNTNLYSFASNQITVNVAGTYLVSYAMTAGAAGFTNTMAAWVENATVGIVGSHTKAVCVAATGGTASKSFVVSLSAGAVLRLRATRVSGTGTLSTQANQSTLSVTRLS